MSEDPIVFQAALFAKTPAGQAEIQSRSAGLVPLVRRLLVLIDGKRNGLELAPFAGGQDVQPMLKELLDKGLISAQTTSAAAPTSSIDAPAPTSPAPVAQGADWLAVLPPADARSAKDLDMARNFMTNTVNNIFGHHNRISLVEAIHGCQSAAELRDVYAMWATALETTATGRKRLPELREKLFAVL